MMSEHSQELVWTQLVDEGDYASASKLADASIPAGDAVEFTEITPEIAQNRVDLSVALSAAKEFLESADQPSSRAEALLFDIDRLQEALSHTVGIEPHTASSIAALTPQLETIALLKLG